ncbi:hypothetical protein Tco_0884428 [Tanacetum coccineum]
MSSTRLSLLGDRGEVVLLSLVLSLEVALECEHYFELIGCVTRGIKEATPDPLLKNVPVIVLSDEDSDVPTTNKRRRLTKNGSIVNDNVHIISSSDDVVLPLSIKKTNQEEIESDDECPIRFSRNRNIKLQSSSKILTGSLIDEDTDEDNVDF